MAELTTRLVRRLLETPALVETVQRLPTDQVGALIERVGIEDAGEFVAMLGDEQFAELMDDVLWDGRGEFDHERFETWLEVVAEGGGAALARRLQSLPEDTLALALFGHVFVVDAETLGMGMAGASPTQAALAERVLDAALYLELADHKLIARRLTGWDTIIDALLALDRVDHPLLERLLDTLSRATAEHLDEHEGLETLLDAAESLEEDAADGRERRRAARGFVRHADATAFLKHAASTPPPDGNRAPERHYLTRAALLELAACGETPRGAWTCPHHAARRCSSVTYARYAPSSRLDLHGDCKPMHSREFHHRLLELGPAAPVEANLPEELAVLVEAEATSSDPQLPPAGLSELREALREVEEPALARRQNELAYLANVLVAAQPELEPVGAARRVLEACAAGLLRLRASLGAPTSELPEELGMDQLFLAGWPLTGGSQGPFASD